MIAEGFINALKTYREPLYTKKKIAERFPLTLANCCRTMKVTNILGKPQGLLYDWGQLQAFKTNMGIAISHENYECLYNIIIDFFDSYNYKIITPKGHLTMFTVKFPDYAKTAFTNTCNDFKSRAWNDIIDDFIDALVDFLRTATVHGDGLEEWH